MDIPEHELSISFARSGGKGGQNVNKVATKATVRWRVGASAAFSEEEKQRLRRALGNRLTKDDEIIISASAERSQLQNRVRATARLNELAACALRPKKVRRPTKPTRAAKEWRLLEKRSLSARKRIRRIQSEDF